VNETFARITLELPVHQTLALAQFARRVGWREIRMNSVDLEQAHEVRAAIEVLRKALAEEGFLAR